MSFIEVVGSSETSSTAIAPSVPRHNRASAIPGNSMAKLWPYSTPGIPTHLFEQWRNLSVEDVLDGDYDQNRAHRVSPSSAL
ncbi:hypothetical protein VB780_23775 [Leptolyngbya sp. CCNP1308]|uniref:hypothetical protein n=1 Tax=Leptolyngbya sp. CCNP1308 TaxID=3110255 RepID=UPI002B218C4E|nr:hypothetical protein [Leptolyngbya sp. CCNP1308]MEA5451617.1 hypothetical protein [Leptolyngbya sp. CCNP1308]